MDREKERASEAGRELGSLGAAKGGTARARKLTPEQRQDIARLAAQERWQTTKGLPKATHGDDDHPLRIGEIEIPCYVLEDERRVLAQRGMYVGLALTRGGTKGRGDRLSNFVGSKPISTYVSNDLLAALKSPIRFLPPHGGVPAYGYEATVLADICDSVLEARKSEDLRTEHLKRVADQCEILTRAFARVGIIALVDEATGYQDSRAKNALARILEKFIAEEIRKWVKTFPDDFYKELFRLREWDYPPTSIKKPRVVALFTNQIVYERLAPGVLAELRKIVPRDDKGRTKYRYHQRLTEEVGHPKLREHLAVAVALMKISSSYKAFENRLDQVAPRFNHPYMLDFAAQD